jgi:hypothetical protein
VLGLFTWLSSTVRVVVLLLCFGSLCDKGIVNRAR